MLTFPRWKYFAILVVLIISVIYALPNAYPQDPSVQITAARTGGTAIDAALAKKVDGILAGAKIPSKSIKVEDGNLMVRLNDTDQQTKASDLLRPQLGSDYVVALSLAPTVPNWLASLGAKPMPRGLDLQGGVHFVMQVDQAAALDKRLEAYVEDVRATLRDNSVPYTSVVRRGNEAIVTTLAVNADADKAQKQLRIAFPTLTQNLDARTLTLEVPQSELQRISLEAIEQNLTTLRNRINAFGVAEPVIQRQGTDRIVIQLPGLQDTAEAKRQIGATATLEFRAGVGDRAAAAAAVRDHNVPPEARVYYDQNKQPVLLSKRLLVSGDQLINAVPGTDSRTGQPQVSITLNAIGGQRMLNHTLENVGKPLGIVYVEQVPITQIVDGKEVRTTRTEERVISNSTIQGVFGKEFQTTGLTREESTSLAKQLKSGALAAPMTFVEERVVGPSLGADNVKRGTTAVMFSFIFALTFFLIYYRMFGLITCLALLLNLLMVIAVMSLPFVGATMSLPGFAGLALSVGMSVDANVLINERIREELRAGMPPQSAIATGYDKASGTIFDSNMTALLAGLALLMFGTGPLKGFAITMIVGILTSVFTAVTVSRGIATLIYGNRRKLKSIAI
ncbi:MULTISPECIES: protein translocase subunit SecD [unclassified Lysobacter]|uniref:protein translocase subunit SecD n=1 Tax=unclassified Lysobacter TaxID=2635362 RepID=UPI001BE62580|nr:MULTISPECIES: protein translocase subunit SecD [unclassified Lysobacter]MBT2745207.1 protein translocase subunit SecD [Lysobacter sp. ISL-42]MBT2751376.1 protein translocase subunit SecD [Lysobacter sp. ISL-50]MBT2777318.1 protein translocase subunit SecD [Lysobacter sp. ISL-54]MBT2781606.1 protein translocase subunit SecD [Lysobacter sp. ISL-52]